jgi:hypothetical protein
MKTISFLILLCIIAGTSFAVFNSKNNGVEHIVIQDKDTLSHNYLMIGKEVFILKLNHQINEFSTKEDLFKNIINNRKQISNSRFNIVLTENRNDRDFILDLIDILNVNNITNYKVSSPNTVRKENYESIRNQDEKIGIGSSSTKIEMNDSTFKISLNNQQLESNDIIKIDGFVKNHLKEMRNSKIYILGNREATFQETKPIFDLLKKYDLLNFKIIAK